MFEEIMNNSIGLFCISVIALAILAYAILSGMAKVIKAEEGSRIEVYDNNDQDKEWKALLERLERLEARLDDTRDRLHFHETLEEE
jgi:hypothetical protein